MFNFESDYFDSKYIFRPKKDNNPFMKYIINNYIYIYFFALEFLILFYLQNTHIKYCIEIVKYPAYMYIYTVHIINSYISLSKIII